LVVLGQRMRERVISKGVSPTSISVIHNWADGRELYPDEEAGERFAAQNGLTGKFRCVYSGNLGNSHDLDTLLGAAEELRNRHDITFVFIGEGPQKARIERRSREMGLPNVLFLRFQPRSGLRASLNSGHVHLVSLMPALDGLVVPSKLYGIMAVGKPVVFVGPEKSEVADIVCEAECGSVVRPGDAKALAKICLELCGDETLRLRLGAAGRRCFSERFERRIATTRFADAIRAAVT
jgi:glycosyltransferase involved in cell wall biosynthesis